MREVVREHCQSVLGDSQLQGEAMLEAFKPRGYSECIVIAGGEDRRCVTFWCPYFKNFTVWSICIPYLSPALL